MQNKYPLLRPDTQLFIYYLEGTLPPHQSIETDNFIGNWVEDGFSFLFFVESADAEVDQLLSGYPELNLLDRYEMSYGQWQGGAVEPVRIGHFLLNPTWIKASAAENEISITLDSGVVFGNGAHPTTQACLEAIEIACMGKKPGTMLDLGCGTGILALAGAKLGCEKVLAVDFNYLATRTARTNVSLNTLEKNILVVNGQAQDHLSMPSDLLVANIHYDVMKDLIRSEYFLRHGWFVLSGLLQSETAKVIAYLKSQPVLILKQWNQDGVWNTILGITQQQQ